MTKDVEGTTKSIDSAQGGISEKDSSKSSVKSTSKAGKTSEKHRFFAFILYPESLPDDWLTKLELLDIPMAISPLHNKDKVDKSKLTDDEKVEVQHGKLIYKKSHYLGAYFLNKNDLGKVSSIFMKEMKEVSVKVAEGSISKEELKDIIREVIEKR